MTTQVKRPTLEERLWAHVEKTETCWIWTGSRTEGYGYIYTGGKPKKVRVHRLSYTLLVGPIPDGLVLDHLCRNRACVNPAHLEPVTNAENIRRGETGAELRNGDTCRKGLHPWPDSAETRADGWIQCSPCSTDRKRRARAHEGRPVQCPCCGVTVRRDHLRRHQARRQCNDMS